MRTLLLTSTLAAILAAPASAPARTQRAQAGAVSAAYSYSGRYPNYAHERLTISRAGTTVYDRPVTSRFCGSGCAPGAPERHLSSVHVEDLDASGEPEVVLDLYTGGAHCCSVEQVFSFSAATDRYVRTERDFGDPGARLEDLRRDGRLEFVTADDRFAYTFTDYAASGLPLRILAFRGGRFHDVTRHYPALIGADAKRWLRRFKHSRLDNVGFIAAWAADQYLLGHETLVRRTLSAAVRHGRLRTVVSPALPGGKAFVDRLYGFLRRHGYTR
jgi:hypothetical protein